jgi:SAM-dependent methyltransferase
VAPATSASHLGGFTPGGDPASWYPALWDALVVDLGVRSVIDVGCGEGQAAEFFYEAGCEVEGVDGCEATDYDWLVVHDYTTGPYLPKRRFDLCWACEFVEHVKEIFVLNFVTTFLAADLLLMSHATPGQGGHHHVNCQPSRYWIDLLGLHGFQHDPWLSIAARELAAENPAPHNYFARTGLAFRR